MIRNKMIVLGTGIALSAALLFGAAAPAAASEYQVYDEASLFSAEETEELSELADALETQTDWDVIIYTSDENHDASVKTYAEEKFNEYTDSDDGILFLLDMYERTFYIATAGEVYEYISDDRIETMLDDAVSYAQNQDYASSMYAMLEDTSEYYQAGIPDGMTIYNEDTGTYYSLDSGVRSLTMGKLLAAAAAGAIACLIFCLIITGKYRLKFGRYRYNVREHSDLNLHRNEDRFVRQFVTRRRIERTPPPNGGGGGGGHISSTHTGAGGRTFGGGGRGF